MDLTDVGGVAHGYHQSSDHGSRLLYRPNASMEYPMPQQDRLQFNQSNPPPQSSPFSLAYPSLPSCQVVQLTHRFAFIARLVQHRPPHTYSRLRNCSYLLTNPLPTSLALHLPLDDRVIRSPSIHSRNHKERERND